MSDYLFRGTLSQVDPDVHQLINLETERQFRKLIMIPSESTAPLRCANHWDPFSRIYTPKVTPMKKPAG